MSVASTGIDVVFADVTVSSGVGKTPEVFKERLLLMKCEVFGDASPGRSSIAIGCLAITDIEGDGI